MAENMILSLRFPCPTPATQAGPVDDVLTTAFQQLCVDASQSHHCQIILNVDHNSSNAEKRLEIETHQSIYSVTITGAYQNVMSARGALMRNSPLKAKLSIEINKTCISLDAFPVAGSTAEQQAEAIVLDNRPLSSKKTTDLAATALDPRTQACSGNPSSVHTTDEASPFIANSPTLTTTTAPIPASVTKSFSPYFTILPKFKAQVDQIASSTETSINLVCGQFHALASTKPVVAAHARQEMVELQVSGSWENAVAARLLLLAAIDALQPGIVHEKLEVELKFQNMIGGRKRDFIQDLMAKTRTSIYLESPFVQSAKNKSETVDPRYNEIHITGEPAKIQIVKDALSQAYARAQAISPMNTRRVDIASHKVDWMLLNHRDKLRTIMIDNASFIAFPPLGDSHPIIFVYGESRVNVERTIRTVMQLSAQFHSGSISMLSPIREDLLTNPLYSPNVLSPIADISNLVSQATGAEVQFRNNGFFIFGNEVQSRIAVQHLTEVDFIKTRNSEVNFSVELASEHREFISGKKNGKINRIMKVTGAKIKFDSCNEYNFYVDISSNIAAKAIEALTLLQEELPAEISFYVPETYHKRIIGVGGKNIQRIMKKYGVYVKFSNSEEFASLGGYFDNLDNVVARTPSKNAMNLEHLKHDIMELVNPKVKDFVHHSVIIPKQYHLSLLSDHAGALSKLQDATNSAIRFPEKETGSDVVLISGPQPLIQQVTSMLLSLVDEQYVYPVPFSEAMVRVLAKPEFKTEVLDKMKNEWNMTLVPPTVKEVPTAGHNENSATANVNLGSKSSSTPRKQYIAASPPSEDPTQNGSTGTCKDEKLPRSLSSLTDGDEEDHVFIFKYSRNNESYLQDAKELLVQYLIDNQIEVYDDEIHIQRPRSDSFAEAFPHFNSKILSSVAGGELPSPAPTFLNYTLFESAGNAFETLNRTPSSSGGGGQGSSVISSGAMVIPDIRALFSHGSASGLPSLDPSPPRWPDQHSRQMVSLSGSSSTTTTATISSSATGPSLLPGQTPGLHQISHQLPSYNHPTSKPIDPWTSPGKQHPSQQHQHQPSTSGYPCPMGHFRTPPPGFSNPGCVFYPVSNHGQQSQLFSPEGPYGGTMGYHTTGASAANHLYSNNNSPVQGLSGNFSGAVGHQLQQDHQPSPRRPTSGTFVYCENMQFLDDKIPSLTFGSGYGPSLNSGNAQSHHQTKYQQQAGQAYSPQYPFGQSIQYPQQRQRHSSHNSTTSHHTMFLGPMDGGLGSAGGSVNSDDISTEDESDDAFDDMRNRHGSYQYQHQGVHGGFGPQTPPHSVLSNRRGSVPSMGSMHSCNQQLYHSDSIYSTAPLANAVRLSNSGSDFYGRKSLISAISGLSMVEQSDNFGPGRSLVGTIGTSAGPPLNIPSLTSGSVFGNERDLFSSGLGGIIGGGTISHSNTFVTHSNPANGSSQFASASSRGDNDGHIGSTLSPSALTFFAESTLDRSGQHMVGGWDH